VKRRDFLNLLHPHGDKSAADDDCDHESRDQILHIFLPHCASQWLFFRLRRDTASPKGTVFVKRRHALFVRGFTALVRCAGSVERATLPA
jgi:hypothetical protein